MQLTDWTIVEVVLLFIGLTHISFDKTSFDPLGSDQSSFRLPALVSGEGGGCTLAPFHYIYHHAQSFYVPETHIMYFIQHC
jgi:hypothetical protein